MLLYTAVNKDTLKEYAINISSNIKNAPTRQPPGQVRTVTNKQEIVSLGLYAVDKSVKPFTVDLKLNGKPLCIKLDTGATVSLHSF